MLKILCLSFIAGIIGMIPSVIGIALAKRQTGDYYVSIRIKTAIITFFVSFIFAILCFCTIVPKIFNGLLISLWPALIVNNYILVFSSYAEYYKSEFMTSIVTIIASQVLCIYYCV